MSKPIHVYPSNLALIYIREFWNPNQRWEIIKYNSETNMMQKNYIGNMPDSLPADLHLLRHMIYSVMEPVKQEVSKGNIKGRDVANAVRVLHECYAALKPDQSKGLFKTLKPYSKEILAAVAEYTEIAADVLEPNERCPEALITLHHQLCNICAAAKKRYEVHVYADIIEE